MKRATLAIIERGGNVLLGWKKKGEIGTQTLNGPGGKVEAGESDIECLVRETREELGILLDAAALKEPVAHILFYAAGVPDFEVVVYKTDLFSGEPQETADMVPEWHPIATLPFERMLESDRTWFEKAAKGERFRANVFYREQAKGFERIEFLPL